MPVARNAEYGVEVRGSMQKSPGAAGPRLYRVACRHCCATRCGATAGMCGGEGTVNGTLRAAAPVTPCLSTLGVGRTCRVPDTICLRGIPRLSMLLLNTLLLMCDIMYIQSIEY